MSNKFTKGTKSFFKGAGEVLTAMAEADAEKRAKLAEIDADIAARQLERDLLTGRATVRPIYTFDTLFGAEPQYLIELPRKVKWSPVNQGHLITCPTSCEKRHCPDCGEFVSGTSYVRCYDCR